MSECTAGRKLDAEVAEQVFGAVVNRCERGPWRLLTKNGTPEHIGDPVNSAHYYGALPDFSTSITAAWLVVERMRERGILIDVETLSEHFRVIAGREGIGDEDIWVNTPSVSDASAPFAICRVALLACASVLPSPREGTA